MAEHTQLISISDIIYRIRLRWKIAVAVWVLIIAVAAALIIFLPEKYEATALIEFDWGESTSQNASILGDALPDILSGLGNEDEQLDKTIALLKSRAFIIPFIERNDLRKDIFPDGWDAERGVWEDKEPSLSSAYGAFLEMIDLTIESPSGFIRIYIRHENRERAIVILSSLLEQGRDFLRQRELRQSKNIIGVVEGFLQKSQSEVVRQVVANAAREQIAKRVMIEIDPSRPLRLIDEASAPEHPSWPNKALVLLLAIFFSFVGVLIVGLFETKEKR